jgi:hypothetical protein
MRRTHVRSAVATILAALPLAAATASCQDPTQVTLVLSSDPQCAISGTAIYVGATSDEAIARVQTGSPEALTTHCDHGDVGTLVVTPGQMSGAVVVVAGVGKPATDCSEGHYDGCIVSRRSFNFVRHTPLRIPIELDVDCENVPCDATTTCVHGHCKSASVTCNNDGCSNPSTGGDVAVDGGPMFYPDGAMVPVDAGMTFNDGSTNGDSSVAGNDGGLLDSGSDGSTGGGLDAGDSGIVVVGQDGGFDAGNTGAMCVDDGMLMGHLVFKDCGTIPTCGYPLACCVGMAGGAPQCLAGDSCDPAPGIGCCTGLDCPVGKMCCVGGAMITTPLHSTFLTTCIGGMPIANGPPGRCF